MLQCHPVIMIQRLVRLDLGVVDPLGHDVIHEYPGRVMVFVPDVLAVLDDHKVEPVHLVHGEYTPGSDHGVDVLGPGHVRDGLDPISAQDKLCF